MLPEALPTSLTKQILHQLGVAPALPTTSFLDALIMAYASVVPWESASRIARTAAISDQAQRVCWAEDFWSNHLADGTGGTCFESNFAFSALLQSLGFAGYLTINNMGKTVGCHSAIVILIEGEKWLVDAGMLLYLPLPLNPKHPVKRQTPHVDYWVVPVGGDRYQIERIGFPFPNAYTLIDKAVPLVDYRSATIADYSADGFFLDAIVINKLIDGFPYRFNQREKPWCINRFDGTSRKDLPLGSDEVNYLAQFFGINAGILHQAWQATT